MFGTVKERLIGRHLTFVPLGGITIGPDNLRVAVAREQVKNAPNIELQVTSSRRRTDQCPDDSPVAWKRPRSAIHPTQQGTSPSS